MIIRIIMKRPCKIKFFKFLKKIIIWIKIKNYNRKYLKITFIQNVVVNNNSYSSIK